MRSLLIRLYARAEEYYYPAVEEPIEKPLEGAIGPKART
jgi:hypothetical protein